MERIKIRNEKGECYQLDVELHHLDEALDQINMMGRCEFIDEEIVFKEPFTIDVMADDDETVIGKLTHERSLIQLDEDEEVI